MVLILGEPQKLQKRKSIASILSQASVSSLPALPPSKPSSIRSTSSLRSSRSFHSLRSAGSNRSRSNSTSTSECDVIAEIQDEFRVLLDDGSESGSVSTSYSSQPTPASSFSGHEDEADPVMEVCNSLFSPLVLSLWLTQNVGSDSRHSS